MSKVEVNKKRIMVIPYVWDNGELKVCLMASPDSPDLEFFMLPDNNAIDSEAISRKLATEHCLLGVLEMKPVVCYEKGNNSNVAEVYAFEVTELLDECPNAPVNSELHIIDANKVDLHIRDSRYYLKFRSYIESISHKVKACDEHLVVPYVYKDDGWQILLAQDMEDNKQFFSIYSGRNIHADRSAISLALTKVMRKTYGLCGYVKTKVIGQYGSLSDNQSEIYIYEMLVFDIVSKHQFHQAGLKSIPINEAKLCVFNKNLRKIISKHNVSFQVDNIDS